MSNYLKNVEKLDRANGKQKSINHVKDIKKRISQQYNLINTGRKESFDKDTYLNLLRDLDLVSGAYIERLEEDLNQIFENK